MKRTSKTDRLSGSGLFYSGRLMDQATVLIIGGGVIGCAIAHAVSQKFSDVFVVEQNPRPGMATSTRNSGVIHSGIYYNKSSLKARHCVDGNRLMYEFCARYKVPHRRTGKLVVAADAHEEPELAALLKRGTDNGVENLRIVDSATIRVREPHIRGTAALEVPSTGIVSAEDLVRTLARLATDGGAHIVPRAKAVALRPVEERCKSMLRLAMKMECRRQTIEARCVVNAAGTVCR